MKIQGILHYNFSQYKNFLFFFFSAGEHGDGGETHWVKRSSLVDSRTSVTDVKFAPKHLGLQLVSIFSSIDIA